jgi:hypothetical protein
MSFRGDVKSGPSDNPGMTQHPPQSFRNTIDAIHPVINAMKAVISP